jgi:peptidoglycan/LPS O-acetylase OafA/YrhL
MPWMDGMRAIAVLGVIVYHADLVQPALHIHKVVDGGLLGVDIFFGISGFLITSLLIREASDRERIITIDSHEVRETTGRGRINFRAFYLRRARRLFPALAALLTTVVVVTLVADRGRQLALGLEHVGFTVVYGGDIVETLHKAGMGNLGQTWSLAIEEQFYLLWPAVLTLLVWAARRRMKVVVGSIAFLTALSFGYVALAGYRDWGYMRVYFAPDTRIADLLIGALLGVAWATGSLPKGRVIVWVRRTFALAGVLLVAELFHNPGFFVEEAARHGAHSLIGPAKVLIYPLVSLATTCVIWELVDSPEHFGHRILAHPALRGIGRISYAVYLWDGTLVAWLTPKALGFRGWAVTALHITVTFVLATLSWFLIERRFSSARRRAFEPQPKQAPSVTIPGRGVSSPSRNRMSSSATNTLTNLRKAPASSKSRSAKPG